MSVNHDAVQAAIETAVATIDPDPDTSAGDSETPDAPADSSDDHLGATEDDAPASDSSETPTETTPPPADAPPAEDETELKAIEQELVTKTPGLKKGKIDIARHQAVLTRQRRQAEAEAKKIQDQLAALEPLKQFNEREWQDRLAAITLAEQNPEVFVKEVLLKDPRYAKLREPFVAKADPPAPQQTVTEAPQPDVLLTDGRLTYSPEQAAKLAEWKIQEQAKSLQSKYDKAIEELRNELQPIKQDREHTERLGQSMRKMSVVLADARANWPGFTENETKIHALISQPGNERMQLEEGYRRVVLPALHEQTMKAKLDRDKIRAEERAALIKEWNAGKPTTLVPGQLPEATGGDGRPRETTDVIKDAMRKAGLK